VKRSDAEFVALRVSHRDSAPDSRTADLTASQCDYVSDRLVYVINGKVQVDAILDRFGFGHSLKDQRGVVR
jgi:hypothetical protein